MNLKDFDPPVEELDRELARRLPQRRAECAALVNALLVLHEAPERSLAEDLLLQALGALLREAGEDASAIQRHLERVLRTRQPLAHHLHGRDPNLPLDQSWSFAAQMAAKVAILRFRLGLSAPRIRALLDALYQLQFPSDDFLYELAKLTPPSDPPASPLRRRQR